MAKEVKVPKMAEGAESATVSEILVKEGDTVEKEQSLITVESDKASLEVPSDAAGKVKEIKVAEGDEISVGDVILILEGDGEGGENEDDEEQEDEKKEKKSKGKKEKKEDDAEEETGEDEDVEKEKDKEKEDKQEKDEDSSKEKKEPQEEKKEKDSAEEEPGKQERKAAGREAGAGPSARRLARELGLQLQDIHGSGPEGRILEDDVKAYASEIISGKITAERSSLPDFSRWGEVERKPLSSIRKTTAEHVTSAWQQVPHVTHFDEADVTELEKFREEYSQEVEKQGGKLTITAILLKIAAAALAEFPTFNASIDMQKGEVVLKQYINIGIAVDTEHGLLVPVIRDVDKKPVTDLALELEEVAEKARNQKLKKEDMEGGNFIISNLGGIGGTNFTPIIYQPQVAILGVSRTSTKPVWRNEQFEPRQVLPLSLSYDHRLIDGASAARFMRWICEVIEKPYKMLME